MLNALSLFFPCHNEEGSVNTVIEEALRIAPTVASIYEIIIVDDGSTDATASKVKAISAAQSTVRLVHHDRCQGYGAALRSGIANARYPWIFYSDGDGQFTLDELPQLVAHADAADIISGYRVHRADPAYRRINSAIFNLALKLFMTVEVRDINCAFKLYRREIFSRLQLRCSGALINAEIFAKAKKQGCRFMSVGVTHRPRATGVPTGAHPAVIFKAMKEFWSLYREVHNET